MPSRERSAVRVSEFRPVLPRASSWPAATGKTVTDRVATVIPAAASGSERVRFRFELRLADGDDVGTFETAEPGWTVGDTLVADGNRRYRITKVVTLELVQEFVDGPLNGFLEVEAL